jgi:hypothetical protein
MYVILAFLKASQRVLSEGLRLAVLAEALVNSNSKDSKVVGVPVDPFLDILSVSYVFASGLTSNGPSLI